MSTHPASLLDERAFADLVREVRPLLVTRAARNCLTRNAAEDCVQTTLMKAWVARHTWADRGQPPVAWFTTILNNVIIDYGKKAYNRYEAPIVIESDAASNTFWEESRIAPASDGALALQIAERRRATRTERIWAAIERAGLTAEQLDVLRLRYADGLPSFAEVAARLPSPRRVGAAKCLDYRARRALARCDSLRRIYEETEHDIEAEGRAHG